MYMYPDNLKSRATLWLWQLKDLRITGVCAVASVLALTQPGICFPAVLTAVYAFSDDPFRGCQHSGFYQICM